MGLGTQGVASHVPTTRTRASNPQTTNPSRPSPCSNPGSSGPQKNVPLPSTGSRLTSCEAMVPRPLKLAPLAGSADFRCRPPVGEAPRSRRAAKPTGVLSGFEPGSGETMVFMKPCYPGIQFPQVGRYDPWLRFRRIYLPSPLPATEAK